LSLRAVALPLCVVGVTHPQTCLVLRSRLRALSEAGFRMMVVSSPGALLEQTAAQEGVEFHAIPICREISPFRDLISLVRLWRLLCRLKPAIVEFSTPKAGFLGSVAAWLSGVPRRIYMLRGLKLESATGFKRVILLAAEQVAAASAHVVLCNSGSLLEKAQTLGVAPSRKLRLLGDGSSNGVDMDRYQPGPSGMRAVMGIPRPAPVVGFVGRLTRDKGVPELVEAFDAILKSEQEAHLLLVGWFDRAEDALDDKTVKAIESHPRIHCTGFVPSTVDYYRVMDVMVLPTWREGFPNVVLEAAATGVPVITTISTGSRDSVLPEVTGLLIPPGHPEAIVEAVLTLLGDPERRRRMGAAARYWVQEHFMDRRVLALTADFYRGALADFGVAGE